jgi:putative hydrolase of the HAD superfamily
MKIVFDFGGVLFSWHPVAMLQREIPHVAHNAAEAVHWVAQIFQGYTGDWGDFDRGAVQIPELVQRIARRTGLAAADVQTVVDGVPRELQPIPESVALVRELHAAGHELYFLSNMPAPYADHLQSSNDFMGCFTDGVFSGRVGHNKPERAIFEVAAKRFGAATPHDLLFLDDHAPNVQAAQALGWQALQFTNAAQARALLHERALVG